MVVLCQSVGDGQCASPVQEREAKRAKLKAENAHAYIQQDTATSNGAQARPITAVSTSVDSANEGLALNFSHISLPTSKLLLGTACRRAARRTRA